MDELSSLLSLFVLSFLSSTLLPGGSEAYLSFLVLNTSTSKYSLLLCATIANTLGGFTNWIIGYAISIGFKNNDLGKKIIPKTKHYQLAEKWINKWAYLTLLLSWLPLMGDILCLVAGGYKLDWFRSIMAIFVGKLLRYAVLIYLVQELS